MEGRAGEEGAVAHAEEDKADVVAEIGGLGEGLEG